MPPAGRRIFGPLLIIATSVLALVYVYSQASFSSKGVSLDPQMEDFSACTELVTVCGHATYIGDGTSMLEKDWLLNPRQRSSPETSKASEHQAFLTHILAGALICEERPQALLMFSGGRTTQSERSEAGSYRLAFLALRNLWGLKLEAYNRCATEDLATDSYENLLFSILRFRQLTGGYPHNVIVVTHAFKERRFYELHARAIKWPQSRLQVHGINPPFTLEELEETQKLEYSNAYSKFTKDPYGARPPIINKRKARNAVPGAVNQLVVDDEVQDFLKWTGGETGVELYPSHLPWEM